MSKVLEQKVAVVTGGGSGIGQAIAERFAKEGAQVCILDFNKEGGEKVAHAIVDAGGLATFYCCDISDEANVVTVFTDIAETFAPVDILVNNAGIAAIGSIENCGMDEFDRVYAVNVRGTANCLKAAVEQMKDRGGAIVNMASIASHIGISDRFAYSMSKGAVMTMTYSVATDYVQRGIRCNNISPGRVHTPFVDGFIKDNYPGQEEEIFEKLSASQPMGRMGQPEEIAGLALYLCGPESGFITGSDFSIDGGFVKIKNS